MKIVLSGVVGVGKSTISKELAKLLKYKIMDEPVTSNPYLDDFYQNPLEYAFKMQVFMLMARSKQLKEAQNFNNVIFDRSILEDPIFVEVLKTQNNMNDRDYEVYLNFYNNVIISSLYFDPQIKPDLIVYLKANLENTIERINLRGRESEKHVDHEYWSLLNKKYEQWYEKEKNNFNFLVIDTNDLTPKEIVQKIIDYIK
ncbi:deoxynucleoside kinase [Spiroplasma ixodetis]|uniref:deoxynucleoside kinase n=1 Tax=Spiroplasma ixodetis TaxID=2141 RepID=UPI0025768BCE|nr:deoxynucleoside kinase [Spiroplasma ixodetis]WJG69369.1 deoxyadenosine/deoxycytidine kinase [Spiroplasma ixodetis Y32]